ncbi:molybdopterin-binding protein, partial [Halobacteriales archaeon QS_9_67_15]
MDSGDSAAFGWAATTVVWLLGVLAVAPLVGGHPLAVAAQAVIEVSPGPVATVAIETLGGLAQVALMSGIAVTAVASAAGIAAFAEGYGPNRRQQRLLLRGVAGVVVALTAVGFWAASDGVRWRWTLATVLALAGPALLRLLGSGRRRSVGRRRTLRNLGGAVGAVAVGGVAARSIGGGSSGVGPDPGDSLDAVAEKREQG